MAEARTIEERVARIDWPRETVKGARIAVDRWFVEIDGRKSFLLGDGSAIPLEDEDFLAVRHGAYVKVAELVMSADRWAGMLVIGLVLVLVVGGAVSNWPPSESRSWIMALTLVAGIAHSGFGLYEFVRRWREVETVRKSIAFALRGRIPGMMSAGDRRVRPNPFPALMMVATFIFLGWLFSGDLLRAAGLGRLADATEAMFLFIIVAIAVLGTANQIVEARRKV